jgi:hypothetical protein
MTTDRSRAALERRYTPRLLAHARHRFERTPEPAAAIAADLGIHPRSLMRLAKKLRWVRRNVPPRATSPATPIGAERPTMTDRRRSSLARFYTPELLAHARRRYEETAEPAGPIAADLGIHTCSLSRLARNLGWVRRNAGQRGLTTAMRLAEQAHAAAESQAEEAPPLPADAPTSDPATLDRLEQAVLKELASVEAMRKQFGAEPYEPRDAERTARTLANLTDTLGKLKRMRAGVAEHARPQDDYDDMPEDMDAFRNELARRIRAFVESRTAGMPKCPTCGQVRRGAETAAHAAQAEVSA